MRREQSQQTAGSEQLLSQREGATGSLFLVGVPIGHPDDITVRALAILRHVDLVATEDPAATQTLLRHHHLSIPLTSYGPMKVKEKVSVLIHRLQRGTSIALISDCGSPVISDPGNLLVAAAHQHRIPVQAIPGPSAVVAAIAASGFHADSFHFYGDIGTVRGRYKRRLSLFLTFAEPTILFCPPESCLAILKAIAETAPSRGIALACNLTLPHEAILRGTARQVAQQFSRIPPPQAVTVVIEGSRPAAKGRKTSVHTHMNGI